MAARRSQPASRVLSIPLIQSRRTLVIAAVALQAVILAVGWWWTFSVVRREIAESVRNYIVRENAELAENIAGLFPSMLPEMLERGSDDWEELQSIVENLDDLPGDGFACLIDAASGEILCHPDLRADPGLYGSRVNFTIEASAEAGDDDGLGGSDLRLLEAPAEMVSGRARVTPLETHFVATKRLGDSNYRLLVHQRTDRLFEIGRQKTNVIRLTAGGVGLAVIGLSAIAVRAVVRRYDSVFETANREHEDNLRLAQEIQTSTLPTDLPRAPGVDIAGWSQPADETGGDTFDVVGLAYDATAHAGGTGAGPSRLVTEHPDRIGLLLADATGHGIGPALSVTELRAMLRMGMRGGVPLITAVQQINAQLHDDLPPGRFITAWIAEYDVRSRLLRSVAAGHGPVLIYRAAAGAIESLGSDTYPLGVMPELGVSMSVAIALDPGDAVVCVSDGINEAMDSARRQLGIEPVEAALRNTAAGSAEETLVAIRAATDRHLGDVPAQDDRTVVVLKVTGGLGPA
ncbi:MAG: PP2C family protein-serine/threonine phosphatase [Planctomycetota bacterium]